MSELAKFKMGYAIEGMAAPGQPAGVGDRELNFVLYMDPTDMAKANEIFYGHLQATLGEAEVDKLKAAAARMTR